MRVSAEAMNGTSTAEAIEGGGFCCAETIIEAAPAKINLTLEIRGKRSDGYHELESLVAFSDLGDRLELVPGGDRSVDLCVGGPFAGVINEKNLVLRAAELFLAQYPQARGGRFSLDKRIPVAAGLGGGSADAAAAIRALVRASGLSPQDGELIPLLAGLGADIPVCVRSQAAWMTGIGETIQPLPALPRMAAVLVNPRVGLATRDVFSALNAQPLDGETPRRAPGPFSTLGQLVEYLSGSSNDLERPARRLAPVIDDVLIALARTQGCLLARLSGSGPTCFGLYETEQEAEHAAERIRQENAAWWVTPTTLR